MKKTKTKISEHDFLEQHVKMQSMRNIDEKHVIVDKDEWEKTVNYIRMYPWIIDKIESVDKSLFQLSTPSHFAMNLNDLVYLNMFEAEIVTDALTLEEKIIFMEQILSINSTQIKFNQYEVNGKIQPLEILTKLVGKMFDVNVKTHSKTGKVLGIFTFKNVILDGFHIMNLNFDYTSQDVMTELEAWIKIASIEFTCTNFNQIKLQ